MSLLALTASSAALAGLKDDVVAATQAWVDGMNSHDAERVVGLYDPEAVLWGARSASLRRLQTVPPSYRVELGEQRIRIYGDIAINTGTYTFSDDRDGKAVIRPARFSFVFRNRNGRWLIVDHHSSAIPIQ